MKDKIFLCIVVTMVALLGCLGMAEAQDTHSIGTGTFTNEGTPGVTPFAVSLGWYYVHPGSCSVYTDGFSSSFYVYLLEGGYLFTANLAFQIAIAPACQTGNLISVYFFDTSGRWNQVVVHPHK